RPPRARAPAGGAGRGPRPPHPGAARRLCLRGGARPVGKTARGRARSCLGGACLGRGGASDAAERASPCSPARSRNAARRGIGRRGGRVGAARRARLSRRHGHVRRGGRRKQTALILRPALCPAPHARLPNRPKPCRACKNGAAPKPAHTGTVSNGPAMVRTCTDEGTVADPPLTLHST